MSNASKSGTRFYCFSPPVMIATLLVEIIMLAYVLVRYRMTAIGRVVVATLGCLALFQLSEYNVCGGAGLSAVHWSRIGYVAITALPPLGLHLLYLLAGKPRRRLVWFAYGTMLLYMVYFISIPSAFRDYQCTGNYVVFQLGERATILYGAYYYGWLMGAMALGTHWLGELPANVKGNANRRHMIKALIVGYLVFLIPTAVMNSVNPKTREGVPSIMCGFAVLFAFILVGYIAPRALRLRQSSSSGKS